MFPEQRDAHVWSYLLYQRQERHAYERALRYRTRINKFNLNLY